MRRIITQQNCRDARNIDFCYVCGSVFSKDQAFNFDHVPPQSVFSKADKNFPLKLKTHLECHPSNLDDEIAGQLVGLIHRGMPNERDDRLKLEEIEGPEIATVGVFSISLEFYLRRWLMAFHAALYREPLRREAQFKIFAPFPTGDFNTATREVTPLKLPPIYFEVADTISAQLLAGQFDQVCVNNSKLNFVCFWVLIDESWHAFFHIDLYSWHKLGDSQSFSEQICIGYFKHLDGHLPTGATIASSSQASR